jgi:hypothetical protein
MKDKEKIKKIAQEIMILEENNQSTQIEEIIADLSLEELLEIDEYIMEQKIKS